MSRLLYFDCFSGISGDMVVGALLDAGVPFEALEEALGSLALVGTTLSASRVSRAGISATKFRVEESSRAEGAGGAGGQDVHVHPHGVAHTHGGHTHTHTHTHAHPEASGSAASDVHDEDGHQHRSVAEIFSLIDRSALSASGRDRAKALFQRLADVEASIHQMPVEQVHLHEVGSVDSIVDIVGAVFALEWIAADRIVCSPLNVGGGMVHSAHGLFPVPAPATLKLLAGAPIYGGGVRQELVTPTGALIASAFASSFGPIPAMTVERVGYGAGDRDHVATPNVLRVLIGSEEAGHANRVSVLECEIDDMNPQLFGSAMERLYAAGALDVFYAPVMMKKNRPGTLVTVITTPANRAPLADVLFRETTTIGLRHMEVERECLQRDVITVETPLGPIRIKRAWRAGRIVNAAPEFDDCAALARTHDVSVKEVQALAVQAYGAVSATGERP